MKEIPITTKTIRFDIIPDTSLIFQLLSDIILKSGIFN
jgi:hypothetical protein